MAESALDRISCGLGGKTVFQHILNLTPQMLQQPDWKFRHAALMAISGLFAYYLCIFAKKKKFPWNIFFHISSISATGEGCHKQMEAYLPEIMNGVMNFINDPVSLYIL